MISEASIGCEEISGCQESGVGEGIIGTGAGEEYEGL